MDQWLEIFSKDVEKIYQGCEGKDKDDIEDMIILARIFTETYTSAFIRLEELYLYLCGAHDINIENIQVKNFIFKAIEKIQCIRQLRPILSWEYSKRDREFLRREDFRKALQDIHK